jgi:PKD repeat protein
VSAQPDTLTQDGASQSSITVLAYDRNGKPASGQTFRLEMQVNGSIQDFGTLSPRSIVTDSTGRATAVYTAPAPPVAGSTIPTCSSFASTTVTGPCVNIVAIATKSNALAVQSDITAIRLTPPGILLPGGPKAAFTITPTSGVTAGSAVLFDASTSCATADSSGNCANTGHAIASFSWSFGDGSNASGMSPTHSFTGGGSFAVTLTVTNDLGVASSTTQLIAVGLPAAPKADFTFSPSDPAITGNRNVVQFNADTSTSASGHSIVQYNWNFGDPANVCVPQESNTASGLTATHKFCTPGSYKVVLSIMDDAGQKATFTTTVTIDP